MRLNLIDDELRVRAGETAHFRLSVTDVANLAEVSFIVEADEEYGGSRGSGYLTVPKYATVTKEIGSSASCGSSIYTVRASVTPQQGLGTPTGEVNFTATATTASSGTTTVSLTGTGILSGGSTSWSMKVASGTFMITAAYGGDPTYATSQSVSTYTQLACQSINVAVP